MNFKKLLVSFVMLVSTLFLLSTVSAVPYDFTSDLGTVSVKINDVDANSASVIAGELITVEIEFTTAQILDIDGNPESASDVRIKVELEGDKHDVEGTISSFDIEFDGNTYKKSMVLRVPYDLQDDLSNTLNGEVKVWNGESEETVSFDLNVQRPSYSVDFKSINTDKPIIAGKSFPVDVVVKNTGYNKLDDVYVTVSIPELDIEKTVYAGDLFQFDGIDDDDENTVSVTVMITIPYDATEGIYNLEVEARNDDMRMNSVKEIFVKNDFSSIIIANGNKLLFLNPTGSLMALNLEVVGDATLSETVVVIPAGSSRTVIVSATGEYTVNAYTMSGNLVESKTLSASTETATGNNVVTILTASLLVIFLVLLAVLVVLVTKKPNKEEEVSESYY